MRQGSVILGGFAIAFAFLIAAGAIIGMALIGEGWIEPPSWSASARKDEPVRVNFTVECGRVVSAVVVTRDGSAYSGGHAPTPSDGFACGGEPVEVIGYDVTRGRFVCRIAGVGAYACRVEDR